MSTMTVSSPLSAFAMTSPHGLTTLEKKNIEVTSIIAKKIVQTIKHFTVVIDSEWSQRGKLSLQPKHYICMR
jgi:hypothetical protein